MLSKGWLHCVGIQSSKTLEYDKIVSKYYNPQMNFIPLKIKFSIPVSKIKNGKSYKSTEINSTVTQLIGRTANNEPGNQSVINFSQTG